MYKSRSKPDLAYKNRGDLLSNQSCWRINIIIRQKVKCMLHVLETKCQTNTDTEGAVVINVNFRELGAYNSAGNEKNDSKLGIAQFLHHGR